MSTTPDQRKPDREGYLGFKEALDAGNHALLARSSRVWWSEQPPRSEFAHYMHLYMTERFIDKHFRPEEDKQLEAQAARRISDLKNPVIREKITKRVQRLSKALFNERSTVSVNHIELTSGNLKWQTKVRQAEHPHETEGQSWFQVKREADTKYLEYLDYLKHKYVRAVDRQISRVLGAEAKVHAGAALDRARQASAALRARSAHMDKDIDRER